MNIVQKVEPFYNEVWCSEDDFEFLSKIFVHTPLFAKSFINPRTFLFMKRTGKYRQPGFVDYTRNIIVEKGELR